MLLLQADDALIQDLRNKDPKVRGAAADLLSAHRSHHALPSLIEALKGEDVQHVRAALVESLKTLSGQDFGEKHDEWDYWWKSEGTKRFPRELRTSDDVSRTVKPMMDELEAKVDKAGKEIRYLLFVAAAVAFLFVLVMIFFVGSMSSKLKEWKEVTKQTETYLREGQEITRRTDRILEELESKKLDIVGFISKLKEENQAELDRYSDLLQQTMEHRSREEVMALRQKAEKELQQTLEERKGVIEHEFRRLFSEHREKLDKSIADREARFLKEAEIHTLYLEASFCRANGRLDEALRLYKKVLSLRSDHSVAWKETGCVLTQMLRHDEAVEAFQRALQLAPDDPSTLYSLAATLARQGKRKEMLDALARAIHNDGEFKDDALNDPAFRQYWNDPAFKDLAES